MKREANLRNVERIIVPPEKKRRNIKQIKTSILKMEHYKTSKLLGDSSVSTFLAKKNG